MPQVESIKKNDKLDVIFNQILEWYKESGKPVTSPIKDGIINEGKYEAQKVKVLFICKEHNELNDTYNQGDTRVWMNEAVRYGFSKTLARWSYGLLNNSPLFTQVEKGNNLF